MNYEYNSYFEKKVTLKSPEMLAPARMPVAAGKKMANTEKNVSSPRKSGPKFSKNTFAVKKVRDKREGRKKIEHCLFTFLSFCNRTVHQIGQVVLQL